MSLGTPINTTLQLQEMNAVIDESIPVRSVLGMIMKKMAVALKELEDITSVKGVQDQPEFRMQIAKNIVYACKEMGDLWTKYDAQRKEQVAEPELIRHAAFTIVLELMQAAITETKMPSEMAQLFLTTLMGKCTGYEDAVKKKVDDLKKAAKK